MQIVKHVNERKPPNSSTHRSGSKTVLSSHRVSKEVDINSSDTKDSIASYPYHRNQYGANNLSIKELKEKSNALRSQIQISTV